jgi:Fic family protein
VEALVRAKQRAYYKALSNSDKSGSSTPFITFMLEQIDGALEELLSASNRSLEPGDRLLDFKAQMGDRPFSRKDYLRFFKHISMATAGRDLKLGVEQKLLKRQGEKRTAVYTFRG